MSFGAVFHWIAWTWGDALVARPIMFVTFAFVNLVRYETCGISLKFNK